MQNQPLYNWRVLPLTRGDQQRHLDKSEQMLSTAGPGEPPTLYWSQAEAEGLVLGFSQKHDVVNPHTLTELSLPIYHRRAGGTAVLVGPHLLSLDVILPAGHPLALPDLVESYRWLGETWVEALLALGIETRAVSPSEANAQRALLKQPETEAHESLMRRACFGSLSPYEVVTGKSKVVGLDMIRRRAGTLLQAGVLLHWESEMLARLLGHSSEEQAILREGLLERAIGVDTLAGRTVAAEELIAAFERILLTR